MKDSDYQHNMNGSFVRTDIAEKKQLQLANKILFERVNMLYSMSSAGFVATIFNMAMIIAGLRGVENNTAVLIWAACLIAVSGLRFALVKIYQHSYVVPEEARRWEYLFCSGSFAMGLVWAALAWFFFPQADILHRFLIIVVLAGMSAGSTGSLAPSLPAYLGFNIPPLAVMTYLMFSVDEKIYSLIGLLFLVFIVVQTRFARIFRLRIDQTTRSNFENGALLERVKQAEKRLTDAIESFPSGFALFDMNDQLILCNSKYIEENGKPAGIESLIGMKFADVARMAIEKGEVLESKSGLRSYYLQGNPANRSSIRLTRQGDIITMHGDSQRMRAVEASVAVARSINETLFSISQEGMAIIQNGIVLSLNHKLEQLLGYGAGDLTNHPAQTLSSRFSKGIGSSIYMQLQDGQAHQGEIELLKKDGSLLHCHYSAKATEPDDMKKNTVWIFTESN